MGLGPYKPSFMLRPSRPIGLMVPIVESTPGHALLHRPRCPPGAVQQCQRLGPGAGGLLAGDQLPAAVDVGGAGQAGAGPAGQGGAGVGARGAAGSRQRSRLGRRRRRRLQCRGARRVPQVSSLVGSWAQVGQQAAGQAVQPQHRHQAWRGHVRSDRLCVLLLLVASPGQAQQPPGRWTLRAAAPPAALPGVGTAAGPWEGPPRWRRPGW